MARSTQTTKSPIHECIDGKPITYHPMIESAFDGWAEECHMEPQLLRKATETAILTRHHEAILPHPCDHARGNRPNVWHLAIDHIRVIYSVEPDAIFIRGYDYEPHECGDGGGYFSS